LLICVVVLAIGAARANRGAAAIEQSIKMQAQQQVRGARPDRQRDVEELQRQLERAIQMLKQSKLGQGRRGAAALYALPWYLFVGPPGAGKTTAIANSGLNFPVGIDRVRGVGGTRNCDWFFSDKAILLDTAGRYMTEPEDEAEWLSFLDTLKKYRPERPVNGVIVGIGIPEILESTLEEVEWHADTIRNRIEELIRHLGLRFPIYLVFTKTDLLQGFVEFFGELGRREREQVWGCTLRPEQLEADAASVFEEEFDRLYESLLNRRVFRLSHSMKREERQLVYAFPLQFASLREKLALFTHRLFQPNPYQETPVFRGFYFTSGTQEGVPIDRVIQSIAVQFDLPPAAVQASEPELETKSYFIRDLFTDVIVPDQHFARRTSGAARRGRFLQARAAIIALAILGLFVFGVSQALVRSKMTLNRTREAAAAAALVRWTNPADGPSELADLDRLRVEADRLESGSFLTLGLQRAGAVLPSVRSLYLDKSRAFVERYPLQLIQRRLDGLGMARVDSGASQRLYDDLKAYLLLTGESERLRTGESAEDFRSFLARHLGEVSREALQQTDTLAFGADLSDRVNPLTTAYVEAMVRGEVPAFAPNSERVARARRTMDQPLNLAGLYAQLRNRGRDRLQTLTLADLELPPRYEGIFASRAEVPRLYTKEGWESFAEAEIQALSRDPTAEDWVLGRSAQRV
ncbi:MAG TPA: type VI secretion system membrane subunit TssM, partial [Rhodothermales bacterium]